jgi:hypothetical protein
MFLFNIPDIKNDSYILHKLIIFSILFLFGIITNTFYRVLGGCKLSLNLILYKSFETSIAGMIGYGLISDLLLNKSTKDFIISLYDKPKLLYLIATVLITVVITLFRAVKILFYNDPNYDCFI